MEGASDSSTQQAKLSEEEQKDPQINPPENLVNTTSLLKAEAQQASEVVDEVVAKVYDWAVDLMKKEQLRLDGLGVKPIDLQVIDMSVLIEGKKKQINRVIFNSEIDFTKVTQILISQSIACSFRPGYQYVNVVCYISGKDIPIIFPYVYKTRIRSQAGKNNLKHWILINKQFQEAYHLVQSYETIK
ncbi:hypothetical protein FGO68_gene9877 [Halteria grandinella]|uniref:Uncharacterized protein n=1 Tax=Halteria grandinella TaxID=5974 RepID=A0A8J8NHG0_HALGN|nr:hypothetical protein FGO68_gene9877 [Halteria grandinella]